MSALWITEAEVAALVDMGDAIAALDAGLSAEAAGGAVNMVKTHTTFGHGDTLHAIGATMLAEGVVGTKTWAHTEGGANPLLILFDAANGQLVGGDRSVRAGTVAHRRNQRARDAMALRAGMPPKWRSSERANRHWRKSRRLPRCASCGACGWPAAIPKTRPPSPSARARN